MCGLNGIFAYGHDGPPVDTAELLATREHMRVRGPDGAGLWVSEDQRIGLAHRRLAIIDLSEDGAQPMATADRRYQIVFNGEIYNFRALRAELMRQGVAFRSQSDTEVLLHLYARDGTDMCRTLRGMFAFAIWDGVEQSLYLARDTFGVKPLYLHDNGHTLRFASQVKALLAGGAIPRTFSPEGETGYWIWGNVPEPHTLYQGITALEPGSWLRLSQNGRREQASFETVAQLLTAQPAATHESVADLGDSLRRALLDSVRHHLVADVPVGLFLSAGVDSGALASLAVEGGYRLRTLTLGFEEFKGTDQDETAIAEKVARHYGTEHQTVWLSRRDFEDSLQAFLESMDQPSIDGMNTWFVARAASQAGLKVAISGLGGDEFFGGYPSFKQVPAMHRIGRSLAAIPALGRSLRRLSAPLLRSFTSEKWAGLAEYSSTFEGAYLLRRAVRMPWQLEPHLEDGSAYAYVKSSQLKDVHSRVSELEATLYMRNQLLRDTDWASMAHSLEVRVPLIDRVLVQHIAQLRASGQAAGKSELAASAHPPLPTYVTNRPKTGFIVPLRDWAANKTTGAGARHGLRPWQAKVMQQTKGNRQPGVSRQSSPATHALWAPEMATRGGVQSYMWRIWEVLDEAAAGGSIQLVGLSLNDTTGTLARWPNRTARRPIGAAGNKLAFVWYGLSESGRAKQVTVGHPNLGPAALIAKALGRIEQYDIVVHGIEAWRPAGWLERVALRNSRHIISTTRYTAATCGQVNRLPAELFNVVPLCAEPEPAQPDLAFRLTSQWPVLFVGRLSKADLYKGLDHLIAAVALLRGQGLAITLHVIGDGDDRQRLEQLARTCCEQAGAIVFHGSVTDGQLQSAYQQAKAFAMPSAKEGFGIVFVEAMRHGVPCIGGDHGGTPEVYTDAREGLLVRFGEVQDLAAKLRLLYSEPHTASRLGAAARQRFHQDYTFARFERAWREALRIQ